jgi:transcriptional regulator with XRE-family HTH domain
MKLEHLGQQIATYRWTAGLTIAQLAEQSGIAESALLEVERGELDVDVITLNEICCALGVTCERLIDDSAGAALAETVELASPTSLDLSELPPTPKSLSEAQEALNWYRLKRQQYEWVRQKRSHFLQRMRHRRLQIAAERGAQRSNYNFSDAHRLIVPAALLAMVQP